MARNSLLLMFTYLVVISSSVFVTGVIAKADNEEREFTITLTNTSKAINAKTNSSEKGKAFPFEEQEITTQSTVKSNSNNSSATGAANQTLLVTTNSSASSTDSIALTTPNPAVTNTTVNSELNVAEDAVSKTVSSVTPTPTGMEVGGGSVITTLAPLASANPAATGGSMTPFPLPDTSSTVTQTSVGYDQTDRSKDIVAAGTGPPTWALVLIGIMICLSLVFTGLFFTRRHCARRRRDERRLLLRSQEGFFFGDTNTNGSYNNNDDRL